MLLSLPKTSTAKLLAILLMTLLINMLLVALLHVLISTHKNQKVRPLHTTYVQTISSQKKQEEPAISKPIVATSAPTSAPSRPALINFAIPDIESLVTLPEVTFKPSDEIDIHLTFDFSFSGQGAQQGSDFQSNVVMAKPTYQIPPKYPTKAKRNGIEGHITFSLLINQQGEAIQYEVIEEIPKGVFLRSSLRSVMRWKFVPPQSGEQWQQVTVNYSLEG
ncbi:energy transducer TonB [Vibrio kagoshimensis]|uniref:energy transducer TonB n=1 Tax=Vibrio kagoshimensis TaxID=2910244 RepID=UPI003D1B238D